MSKIKSSKEILSNKFLSRFNLEGPWCPNCQYPLTEGEDCFECKRRKREDEKIIAGWIEKIGGLKAWNEYTTTAFVDTNYNHTAFIGAKEFNYRKSSILFHGPKGTGKSHLAAIAKRPSIIAGVDVLTVSMPDVLSHIRAEIKNGRVLDEWIERMISAAVLSIEDMATEKPSDWVIEQYYRIIDGRYRQAKAGLIITMNQ